jgi:hypothetical protein
MLKIAGQALVTDDLRHRPLLQTAIGVDDTLLVVGEQEDSDAEGQHEQPGQQAKGLVGMDAARTGPGAGHQLTRNGRKRELMRSYAPLRLMRSRAMLISWAAAPDDAAKD